MNPPANANGSVQTNGPAVAASLSSREPAQPRGRPAAFWAILRQLCPRCRKGKIFRGQFAMNERCPVCDLRFEREQGYFLGALYISYPLSILFLGSFYLIAMALLPGWEAMWLVPVAIVPYLPFMPAVFRYSRVLWIYLDRHFWPDPPAATPRP
jgi:uncharacterized protein (DUF983 family)